MSDWGGSTWGTLIGFVVGAVLGTLLPGIGWALGASIGAVVGGYIGSVVDPAEGPETHSEGPRLDQTYTQGFSYGLPMAFRRGCTRGAGVVIWSDGIKEHKHVKHIEGEDDKGGGGGGSHTRTTYTYTSSFAVSLGEAVIGHTLGRVWGDGKLLWTFNRDAYGSEAEMMEDLFQQIVEGKKDVWKSIRFYDGSEDQLPDPLIESIKGVGNVPAYRGESYVLIEEMQLGRFGNRRPNMEFELLPSKTTVTVEATFPYDIRYIHWSDRGLVTSASKQPSYPDGRLALWSGFPGREKWHVVPEHFDEYCSIAVDPTFVHVFSETGYGGVNGEGTWTHSLKNGVLIHSDNQFVADGSGLWRQWRTCYAREPVGAFLTGGRDGIQAWKKTGGFDAGYSKQILDFVDFSEPNNTIDGKEITDKFRPMGEYKNKYLTLAELDGDWHLVAIDKYTHEVKKCVKRDDYFGSGPVIATILPNGYILAIKTMSTNTVLTLCEPYSLTPVQIDIGQQAEMDLDSLVSELMEDAGLEAVDHDIGDLAGEKYWGYTRDRPMSAKAALSPLFQTHMFDIVEADWQIKAVTRGGSSAATITENELSVHEVGEEMPPAMTSDRIPETRLPRSLTIEYPDKDDDYLVGTQISRRVTKSRNDKKVTSSVVMSATSALQTVEKILQTAWTEREQYTFRLGIEYLKLTPTDVITVLGRKMFVMETSFFYPSILEVQAAREVTENYTSQTTGSSASSAKQSLPLPGQTDVWYLDLPRLNDWYLDSPGIYLAASAVMSGWGGANLFLSKDGGTTWDVRQALINEAVIGTVVSPPGPAASTRWDMGNTVNVELWDENASLSGSTDEAVLGGENHAAIGRYNELSGESTWLIVGFVNAVQESDGSWTLSRLLQGRKGTEANIGSVKDGDMFVLLSSMSIYFEKVDQGSIGSTSQYKAVSFGKTMQQTPVDEVFIGCNCLKPWAPVHIKGRRDGSGNISITWFRRPKAMGEWVDRVDVPLLEESEEYEVDIYDGETVIRTLASTSDFSGVVYTDAQQIEDFGGLQSDVDIVVYQKNSIVGRGFGAPATV